MLRSSEKGENMIKVSHIMHNETFLFPKLKLSLSYTSYGQQTILRG